MLLPLRPYRCTACDARFFGPTQPLFDRTRALSAIVLAIIVFLLLANAVVKLTYKPRPNAFLPTASTSEAESADTADSTDIGTDREVASSPATDEPDTTNDLETEESSSQDEPDVAQAVQETADQLREPLPADPPTADASTAEADSTTTESPDTSKFVQNQKALNLAKLKGEPAPTPTPPASDQTQPEPQIVAAAAGQLTAVRIKTGDNLTIKLDADDRLRGKAPYFLNSPPRLVLDLPGQWQLKQGLPDQYRVDRNGVRSLRLGQHPNFMRVVLDLERNRMPNLRQVDRADGLDLIITQ
jgi:hypothetical protein